jgi:hypothetical protein
MTGGKVPIMILSNMKTNVKYTVIESLKADSNVGIISDEIDKFTGQQTVKKYPHSLRIIRFFDKKSDNE